MENQALAVHQESQDEVVLQAQQVHGVNRV